LPRLILRSPITSVESPQSLARRRGLPRYKLEDAAYGDEDQREGGRLCPDPGRDKALVNIIVEFSGPTESMTLTVIAPNEGGEADLREKGITRARDFALQFPAYCREEPNMTLSTLESFFTRLAQRRLVNTMPPRDPNDDDVEDEEDDKDDEQDDGPAVIREPENDE
jgi:hypothetical protein